MSADLEQYRPIVDAFLKAIPLDAEYAGQMYHRAIAEQSRSPQSIKRRRWDDNTLDRQIAIKRAVYEAVSEYQPPRWKPNMSREERRERAQAYLAFIKQARADAEKRFKK